MKAKSYKSMNQTRSILGEIFILGSSLSERMSIQTSKNNIDQTDKESTRDCEAVEERMAHWCQIVAQGNWEDFRKRLSWDGLNEEKVRSILASPPTIEETQVFPSWVKTLDEIIQTSQGFNSHLETLDSSRLPLISETPLPFEDLILPAVLVGRQKLLTSLKCTSLSPDCVFFELISLEAYLDLERGLLQQLRKLSIKTFEQEFSHFRPLGHSLLNLIIDNPIGSKNTTHYNAFVDDLLQDGLLTFFRKYPVLGRLIATAINFWVETTVEFLNRLEADREEIQRLFLAKSSSQQEDEQEILNSNPQLDKVIAIKPNLSDFHNRGRSVMILKFESELKLVYKPKSLGLEVAYNQFLDWYNHHESSFLGLKVLTVCDRHNYGWVEHIEHLPIENESEAKKFYQRAGMLMCILYVLHGTDCHNENLIASGEHPVLIDLETLTYHEVHIAEPLSEPIIQKKAVQRINDSVLNCGLLPVWKLSKDGRQAYDISGLGKFRLGTLTRRRWKSINTDDMHLGFEEATLSVGQNEAILGGVSLSPINYIEELIEGFEQMYRFFSDQRQTLLETDGLLSRLQNQLVRFVLRPTNVYGVILRASLAPQFLKHGIDRSIELDILTRAFLFGSDKPQGWSILHSELEAMEQLDIPYFGAKSNSDALIVGLKQPIEKFFKESSYVRVQTKLRKLNDENLSQQVAIIKNAFYANTARKYLPQTNTIAAVNDPDLSDILPATSKQLIDSAQKLASLIEKSAIKETDGSINWIGLSLAGESTLFQLQILNHNLYDGNCGIALFLAALDRVCDSNQFQDLALGAIQPLREFCQTTDSNETPSYLENISIGMSSGIVGQIYSLVKISQFLKKPAILKDALHMANLITPKIIAEDRRLDIMAGAAGAILGLLALYQETRNLSVLEKAILCGQHLLKNRISIDGSPRVWKTIESTTPLTGFSHGAAGIAHALLQLHAVTQDFIYQEAAIEGIAYERSVFNSSAANWPDFRPLARQANGNPGFMVSWCHGAPGIGLARLGSLNILDTAEIRQEIEIALQTTQNYSLSTIDNLCCGDFGRIEFLLKSAQVLGRGELLDVARLRAYKLIARAEERGGYQIFNNLPPTVFSPSFFLGASGIGYELLRLAYPDKLPSVLLGN